jgi:hypothetical protein
VANLKLKRISSSTHAKVIETGNGGYVLGHREPTKYRTYDPKQEQFLDGIFKSEDFTVRNAAGNPIVDDLNEFDINVKGPIGEYSDFVQYRNFAVGLKQETLVGIGNYNGLTSAYDIEPEYVVVYQRPEGVYDQDYMNSLSAPRALLSGLPYAYLAELPLDKVVYNFDDAVLYADSLSMKNPYDYKYDLGIVETVYPSGTYFEENATVLTNFLSGIADEQVGSIVDHYEDTIMASAAFRGISAFNLNDVMVFDLSGDTWVSSQIITGSSLGEYAFFGHSTISLDSNKALIGQPEQTVDAIANAGAAIMFELSGGSWVETHILSSPTPLAIQLFGYRASLDNTNDRAIVSDAAHIILADKGSTYVFELSAGDWVPTQTLTGSITSPGTEDRFGESLDLSGTRMVIGAAEDNPAGLTDAGAAYVYEYSGSTWNESQILSGSLTTGSDEFGSGIALGNDRIVVGARSHTISGVTNAGAAYVFELVGSTWVETQVLTGSLNEEWGHFGGAVAIDGDRIAIGANGEDAGNPDVHDLVYVFDYDGSEWQETHILSGFADRVTPGERDEFGNSFSLRDSRLVIGASHSYPLSSTNIRDGAVYVFEESDLTSSLIALSGTREYDKIGLDKTDAWASYYNGDNWQVSGLIGPTSYQVEPLIQLSDSTDPFYSYQQIERIRGFNRLGGNQSLHKSNIFSIRIRNTNLNEAIEDEDLRNDIQSAINTVIREVIDRISPANTQLWKIIWSGD